jgi:hypothetical protein
MSLRRAAAILFVCYAAALQAQEVTATKTVENWESGKGRTVLRKINGRWWTEDNREVQPPGPGQVFWTPDSRPGTCTFYHHRPPQLARAESLHLFMSRQDVEVVLGQPNRTLGDDRGRGWHGFWCYYAGDGTKLSVRFMGDDGLGEAKYEYLLRTSRPVASVAADLGGRDIYKAMSERATQRDRQAYANKVSGRQPRMTTASAVPLSQSDPTPAKRIVSAEANSKLAVGATRGDVLARLGEPNSRYAITDDDGMRESFTYDLDSGETVVIHLVAGKVTALQ